MLLRCGTAAFLWLTFASSTFATFEFGYNESRVNLETWKLIDVYVGMFIESMSIVEKQTFVADMYLKLSWTDPRLRHPNSTIPYLVESKEEIAQIWTPLLYFKNSKESSDHKDVKPNVLYWIFPNGTVAFSKRSFRLRVKFACHMNLVRYPFDWQECDIRIASFNLNERLLKLNWFPHSKIEVSPSIIMEEFKLLTDLLTAERCEDRESVYKYMQTAYGFQQEEFGCLVGRFYFSRRLGHALAHLYTPSMLVVIVSWVAFWIDANAVPARIALAFTTLLTISAQGTSMQIRLPHVAYLKAIDVYFALCISFVVLALIEYAFVNHFSRKAGRLEKTVEKRQKFRANKNKDTERESDKRLLEESQRCAKIAILIDYFSRVLFPIAFFLCLLIYIIVYFAIIK